LLKKSICSIIILVNFVIGSCLPEIYNISSDSTNPVFVVDKAKQMFYIYQSKGPGRLNIIDSIKASTGAIQGDKKIEGDKKTPEGIYTIINVLDNEDLPEIYGPLALILDYPNKVDRIVGNGGTNIWLHGRNEELAPRQTEGCVSLENHSILEVNKKFVDHGNTKVIIYDSLKCKNIKKYDKKLKQWEKRVKGWRNSWQFGNFKEYKNYYSEKFQDNSSLDQYVARKQRIDRNTNWKKINTEDIIVLSADYEARVSFEQEYITPDFISLGQKELTLLKREDNWKIISETFHPTGKQLDFATSIHNFIDQWEQRKENKNFPKKANQLQGKFIINNINSGFNNDTVYASFQLTTLNQEYIKTGLCKLYLDYEGNSWHLVSEFFNKKEEHTLSSLTENFTTNWVKFWDSGKINQFLDLYSETEFSSEKDNYQSFARRKKQLSKVYSWIDVEVEELNSKIKNENIEISFIQKYNCPNFFSTGNKSLLLARESEGWKIISEEFSRIERNEIEPELISFVEKWQKAWESMKIKKYIDYYADEFQIGSFDRQGWYNDKKEKFENSDEIRVKTSNYRITSPDEYFWVVTFDQIYQSGRYSDQGNKLLKIKGKPGNFKIIEEKWWQ